jgi:hypothetical protein
MLRVTFKPIMLSVVMLNVVVLIVAAPSCLQFLSIENQIERYLNSPSHYVGCYEISLWG